MDRLWDMVRLFPLRVRRLWAHLAAFTIRSFPFWLLEFFFRMLELFGIGDVYDAVFQVLKPTTRPLSKREISLASAIFGESLPYARIRIDERALLGPRQGKFCYVSFYTINSWGKMPDPLLVHELVHVWQYHQLGIVYIPRALAAQYSQEGYNYGGVEALRTALANGKNLLDFNYEQQADLIEDYFRLLIGLPSSWGHATAQDLETYAYFAKQLLPNAPH